MSIASMTGFARAQGGNEAMSWTWEAKSVNGKGLEVRSKLAPGFEGLETAVRERTAARLGRGNLFVSLAVARAGAVASVQVNEALLERLLGLAAELRRRDPDLAPASIDGLLALRGVVEPVEEQADEETQRALEAAMLATFDEALDALGGMRRAEGERLAEALSGHLDRIAELQGQAENMAAAQPPAIRERLARQVRDLAEAVPALSEERLAQEAALLMTKADVREELDRLKAHLGAARDLVAAGGPMGRKLDFLCQEFNREANTVCSKSVDVELTRVGLDLKGAIEQLREQVQNVE